MASKEIHKPQQNNSDVLKSELRDSAVMRPTWLIQRLLLPSDSSLGPNPYSFGVMRNGGLSDNARQLLDSTFEFDLMGAGEYECGAVPKSLSIIYDLGTENALATGKVKVKYGEIFYICDRDIEDGVKNFIKKLSRGENFARTRDYVGLRAALLKDEKRPIEDNVGWLELNNHFFFFTDKTMFEKTAALFGARVAQ